MTTRRKNILACKKWRAKNKKAASGYGARYRRAHKDYCRRIGKRYREEHLKDAAVYRRKNRTALRAASRKHYKNNKKNILERGRIYRLTTKAAALRKYGGKCVGCRTRELAILSIDHINGDGGRERRTSRKIGTSFYLSLLRKKTRNDLQVLCLACQWRKNAYGPNIKRWPRKPLTTSFGK